MSDEEEVKNVDESFSKSLMKEDKQNVSPSTPSRNSESEIKDNGQASRVAEHYNAVPDKGVVARLDSRILYLRNFNNWIKSMLINEFLEKLKQSGCSRPTVLDLCCGKGGDLLKWRNGNIAHLVATDMAEVSLEQCKRRYEEIKGKSDSRQSLFTAEFILADSTKDRIAEKLSDRNIWYDMTSCQFSFHYSFESERQARQMIRNALERLKPGGYFIGTLPDANRIMHCIRKDGSGVYKNEVLSLEFGDKEGLKSADYCPPVFGASFHFSLDTQVNCPEYLVYFPVLKKLMEECGMDLVLVKSFPDAFEHYSKDFMGRGLLQKMKALESFPPDEGTKSVGGPEEYDSAKNKLEELLNTGGFQRPAVVSFTVKVAFYSILS